MNTSRTSLCSLETRQDLTKFWDSIWRSLTEQEARELLRRAGRAKKLLSALANPPPLKPFWMEVKTTAKAHNYTPPVGYSLVGEECTEQPLGELAIERVVFHLEDEVVVLGESMLVREKAIDRRVGPNTTADLLFQYKKIPEDWQGTNLIVPGVILVSSGGERAVP